MSSVSKCIPIAAVTLLAASVTGCTPASVADAIVDQTIVNPLINDLNVLGTLAFCFDNSVADGCDAPDVFSPNTTCEALGVEPTLIGDLISLNGATGDVCYVVITAD